MVRLWVTGVAPPSGVAASAASAKSKDPKRRNRSAARKRIANRGGAVKRVGRESHKTVPGKCVVPRSSHDAREDSSCAAKRETTTEPVDRASSLVSPHDVTKAGVFNDVASSVTAATRHVTSSVTTATECTIVDTTGSTATGQAATSESIASQYLYWRIYGKNYGSSRVTVTCTYATTKAAWHVARVIDRRLSSRGFEYRVLWLNRARCSRRYYQRTWEPRGPLIQDGFTQELDLVDRWKVSDVASFDDFCKDDGFGQRTIAANMEGLCMFVAFKRAAELAGRPDVVTQHDIDKFVMDELQHYGLDLSKGTSWKMFLVFLRQLRDDGRDFVYNAIANNNFAIAGRRGARVLEEVDLCDGVYLVAAYNHSFVGHAIVLTVCKGHRLIFDSGEGVPVSSADEWINFISFVRPVIVFSQG